MEKQRDAEAATKIDPLDPQLWQIAAPGKYTSKERQLFLKLCVENSCALGKGEKYHITVLKDNNVTHLRLLGAIKKARKRLTGSKKKFDKLLSSVDSNLPCQLSVEDIDKEDDNNNGNDMLDILLEL